MRRGTGLSAIAATPACLILVLAGCAAQSNRAAVTATATTQPSTSTADVHLADLQPPLTRLQLRPSPAATSPSPALPPLDAIELYARARARLLANQRRQAIDLLLRAIALDPDSFELRFALAEAYGGVGGWNPQAIEAYEQAAALNPDHLELQTELGRQYLAKGDTDQAVEHLRLALLTRGYRRQEQTSALAEYLLARALQRQGYDTAALELYDRLLAHLRTMDLARDTHPDLIQAVARPEVLFAQVGELYEMRGAHKNALAAYEFAAERRPAEFAYQAGVVRNLMALGRVTEAREKAAELVRRFRATGDSLRLLRDTYSQAGGTSAVVGELTRLHEQDPSDLAVLFALADVLRETGRTPDAERHLEQALVSSNYDLEVVHRLYAYYESRSETSGAARLLVVALAQRPQAMRDLSPLWEDLLRPSRQKRLRIPELQALEIPPSAEASRQFWVAQMAQMWGRDLLSRSALEHSAAQSPPFPPAYRALLALSWQRDDWDEARKAEASQHLIDAAGEAGSQALAAELTGLLLMQQDKPGEAVEQFRASERFGGPDIDVEMALANALIESGQTAQAEQLLWRLVEQHPTLEDAYATLFRYYLQNDAVPQAVRALRSWLGADPSNVNAKLLEASFYVRARQFATAEEILLGLLSSDHQQQQSEVLRMLRLLYQQTGRLQQFIDKLEQERLTRPENRVALEHLVAVYQSLGRTADASRALDAARQAVGQDPDLLYYVAHLYSQIGQNQTMELTLEEVLSIDPRHAPAANDLGYNWADSGRNLDRAEELIRIAVEAEPDNQSFLDSLGWVLYKRAQFAQALGYLQEAIGPAVFPDPVVLDHLGDTLYRLDRIPDAKAQWVRAKERLAQTGGTRQDLKDLGLTLDKKLDQLQRGQPVSVAPAVQPAPLPSAEHPPGHDQVLAPEVPAASGQ
jgi:tetratricopeptide (TPR) repeat protein